MSSSCTYNGCCGSNVYGEMNSFSVRAATERPRSKSLWSRTLWFYVDDGDVLTGRCQPSQIFGLVDVSFISSKTLWLRVQTLSVYIGRDERMASRDNLWPEQESAATMRQTAKGSASLFSMQLHFVLFLPSLCFLCLNLAMGSLY